MSQKEDKLFEPKDDKTLLTTQYPELAGMKEFRNLKHHEQRFVWAYGCVTSRFYNDHKEDKHSRAKKAFEWAYESVDYSGRQYQDFCSLVFPDHIKTAVERMLKFDPSRRGRALRAIETSYEAFIEVLESPIPGEIAREKVDEDTGETITVYEKITPAQIKQVLEAKEKAREALPEIIRLLEEGFGISAAKAESSSDETDADIFIRDQALNSN